jgi:hypothetical protein
MTRLGKRPSIIAIVAVVAAVAFVIWLIARGGSDDNNKNKASTAPAIPPFAARQMSAAQLSGFARSLGHPVYWLGPRSGTKYEVTLTGQGRAFVRYLPVKVAIGIKRRYRTVATYPYKNGAEALRIAGKDKGTLHNIPNGGVALESAQNSTSILFSYPNAQYEVEVYDPTPSKAKALVLAGRATPVP